MRHMYAKPKRIRYRGSPATYYWHSLSPNTFIQCVVLGLVLGPIIALLSHEGMLWYMVMFGLAPLVVDTLKPTVVLD